MPIKTNFDRNGLKLIYLDFIWTSRGENLNHASTLITGWRFRCVCVDTNLLIYMCKEDPIIQISNISKLERWPVVQTYGDIFITFIMMGFILSLTAIPYSLHLFCYPQRGQVRSSEGMTAWEQGCIKGFIFNTETLLMNTTCLVETMSLWAKYSG